MLGIGNRTLNTYVTVSGDEQTDDLHPVTACGEDEGGVTVGVWYIWVYPLVEEVVDNVSVAVGDGVVEGVLTQPVYTLAVTARLD